MLMPRDKAEHVFAIVRVDKFQVADAAAIRDEGWPIVVTVKGILTSQEAAVAETARLNALNREKGCIYFWQQTRPLEPGNAG